MSRERLSGSCLCGSVTVSAEVGPGFDACHCEMCRTWGGGPFLATREASNVHFTGEDLVSVYDSSAWAQRGFCSRCGTHLFYQLREGGQYMLPVGLLGDTENLEFHEQFFIDRKPTNYCFSNDTQDLTGAEVFAKYAPGD